MSLITVSLQQLGDTNLIKDELLDLRNNYELNFDGESVKLNRLL
jgi:hypothetical protein